MKNRKFTMIIVSSLVLLAACPAKIEMEFLNESVSDVVFQYGTESILVKSSESESFSTFVGASQITINYANTAKSYSFVTSSLDGRYYRLGFVHKLQFVFSDDDVLTLVPPDEENSDIPNLVIEPNEPLQN